MLTWEQLKKYIEYTNTVKRGYAYRNPPRDFRGILNKPDELPPEEAKE